MKKVELSKRFSKEYKRQSPAVLESLDDAIDYLTRGEPLPNYFSDHALEKRGVNYAGLRECHLDSDLLLVYRPLRDEVKLHRIGTHVELFGKK